MTNQADRRRFLQTSLATGAALGLAGQTARSDDPANQQQDVNPRVQPGAVRWHRDIEAACIASRASGKPVLHFQMMGRLDQRFC